MNPTWKEEFELEVVDPVNDKLDFSVYDWDRIGSNDLIGVIELPIAMFTGVGTIERWFPLCKKFSNQGQADKLGELHVKVVYYDAEGKVPNNGNQPAAAAAPAQVHPMQAAAMQQQQQPMANPAAMVYMPTSYSGFLACR